MSLNEEERRTIVGMEIEKSRRTFAEVEILRQAGLWNNIATRLFYAAFHAVTALLISEGYPAGSHQGTVIQFHQHFIKTGILPKAMAHSIHRCKLYVKKQITTVPIMPLKKTQRLVLLKQQRLLIEL